MIRRARVWLRLAVRWIVRRLTGRWATMMLPWDGAYRGDLATFRPKPAEPLNLLTGPIAAWTANQRRVSSWQNYKYHQGNARSGIGSRRLQALGATYWRPEYTDRLGNFLSLKRALKKGKKV